MNALLSLLNTAPWMQNESLTACLPVCKSWYSSLSFKFTGMITHRRLSRYEGVSSEHCEGTYSYVFPVLDRATKTTYIMKRLKEGVNCILSYDEAACLGYLRGKKHIIQIDRAFLAAKNVTRL